jgi:hypothetical protein
MDFKSRMESAEKGDLTTILETENIANLVINNSFQATTEICGIRKKEYEKKQLALWTLPLLINHSCVPNLIRFVLGQDQHHIMVIRAREDIQEREELAISYVAVDNLDQKNVLREAYGFECKCSYCMDDKIIENVQKLLDKIMSSRDFEQKWKLCTEYLVSIDIKPKIAHLNVIAQLIALGYAQQEKNCDYLKESTRQFVRLMTIEQEKPLEMEFFELILILYRSCFHLLKQEDKKTVERSLFEYFKLFFGN